MLISVFQSLIHYFSFFGGVFVDKYSDLSGGSATMASSLLLAVVFVLDLVAFALAVAAEQRRNTVSPLSSSLSFFSYFLGFYFP